MWCPSARFAMVTSSTTAAPAGGGSAVSAATTAVAGTSRAAVSAATVVRRRSKRDPFAVAVSIPCCRARRPPPPSSGGQHPAEEGAQVGVELLGVGAVGEVPGAVDVDQASVAHAVGDDLAAGVVALVVTSHDDEHGHPELLEAVEHDAVRLRADAPRRGRHALDRKSTRLNPSHSCASRM